MNDKFCKILDTITYNLVTAINKKDGVSFIDYLFVFNGSFWVYNHRFLISDIEKITILNNGKIEIVFENH